MNERLADPLTPVTVKTRVTEDQVAYLYEHQEDFPGRPDPADLPAQLRLRVGGGAPARLRRRDLAGGAEAKAKEGYLPGDKLGKTGVEATFDEYLRGENGLAEIRVDSMGRQQSPICSCGATRDRGTPSG